MSDTGFDLKVPDGHPIAVRHWPATTPRGVVHVLHGMAEHGARYARLGDVLNRHHWSLVAHDHRGHGGSVTREQDRGHLADRDGWRKVVEDVGTVQGWIGRRHPGLRPVLMGHSMGSFIALSYAIGQGPELDGLILSGTDLRPNWYYRLMRAVLRLEKLRRGARSHSPLVHALTFGSFAKRIPERKTDFDWLSRDESEVRSYIEDPRCGHECSLQLWCDLLDGLVAISGRDGLRRLPPRLPVFLFGGDRDPMSDFGKGVRRMAAELGRHRPGRLKVEILPGGRHESLNDLERDRVMEDLARWLEELEPAGAPAA